MAGAFSSLMVGFAVYNVGMIEFVGLVVPHVIRLLFGTDHKKLIPISALTGGEQQRVILARALAQQTPCLILDEPTNHLDIKFQLQLMDLVRSLDRTVIAAIHDLNIAALYCDRLYAVQDGVIVGQGTPRELLTPAFIRQVYEAESEVLTLRDGILHIIYHPQIRKESVP